MTLFKMTIIGVLGFLILVFFLVKPSQKLGGEVGQIIRSAFIAHNGILTYSYRLPLGQATTTACVVQTPNATTSVVHASFHIRTATGTANLIEIGTGSS